MELDRFRWMRYCPYSGLPLTTYGYGWGTYTHRPAERGEMSPKKFRKKERNRPGRSR
jgi:hypothetical protein